MNHRAKNRLLEFSRLYPGLIQHMDSLRADAIARGICTWQDWCYLPTAAYVAAVHQAAGSTKDMAMIAAQSSLITELSALTSWRMTQGIYRFDPTVYNELVNTDLVGDIPADVLLRMPEWCLYLETPCMQSHGVTAHGAWVSLRDENGAAELNILPDTDGPPQTHIVKLGQGSLSDSLEHLLRYAAGRAGDVIPDTMRAVVDANIVALTREEAAYLGPVISLLLYLCSQNAITRNGQQVSPANPVPKSTRRGLRLFAANAPQTWDVGVRMGAALRAAYQSQDGGSVGVEHTGPRGHIRRAHWHGFRSGPRKRADGTDIPSNLRKFDVRWMPPVPVNLPDIDEMPATIRKV